MNTGKAVGAAWELKADFDVISMDRSSSSRRGAEQLQLEAGFLIPPELHFLTKFLGVLKEASKVLYI